MLRRLGNIFRLGVKELYSFRHDTVMLALVIWSFTFSVYSAATGVTHDLHNAAIAIVDEDRSQLSGRLQDAFLPPYFRRPEQIAFHEIDPAMDGGRYSFVVVIPQHFEADLLAGRQPSLQVDIDATAMSQAGIGDGYISRILTEEIATFTDEGEAALPGELQTSFAFNPNLTGSWFVGVMEIINNVTVLAIILAGAALIREREHGTIEHLLVMPVTSAEIMISKVWANGLIIVVAATLSLALVVEAFLQIPIAGSKILFVMGATAYLFSITSLGILLATFASSMPQFGLLAIPVFIVMNLLSGSTTPLESMPVWLQNVMQVSPSTHYVSFAQAVLYRGAGIEIVWPQMIAMAAIGSVFFVTALLRFRKAIASFS